MLRDAQTKAEEARLEALLVEGLASQSIALDADFWNRVETKTEAILERHGTHKER